MRVLKTILLSATVPIAGSVKILPLGDSITKGGGCESPISYRKFLSDSLKAQGTDFDFVGTRSCAVDLGYDSDHQGMSGWTSENILKGRPEDTNTTLADWISHYRADIALIHLGTNDIAQNHTLDRIAHNLTGIITALRQANPGIGICLAQILPMKDPWKLGERIPALNDSLAKLAATLNVVLVDMNTGFLPEVDLYDGVHPNEAGSRKMAGRWVAALRRGLLSNTLFQGRSTKERRKSAAKVGDPGPWQADGRPARIIWSNPGLNEGRFRQGE